MDATILVDFGMTASAAECLINTTHDEISSPRHYKFGKIPTRLEYGEKNEVLAWGFHCGNTDKVIKLFKNYFQEQMVIGIHGGCNSSGMPPRNKNVEKWTSDYLHHFCSNVLDEVLQRENMAKSQLNAKWYLTTPGCWSNPTQLDFRMLAEKVLTSLLPGSRVYTDITESQASCEFLVDSVQLPDQSWVITCDIGGATCDTALAIIEQNQNRPIPQVFPIAGIGSCAASVGSIDAELSRTIRSALGPDYGNNHGHIVYQLVESTEWQRARHSFDGSRDVVFTSKQALGRIKNPTPGVSINDVKITISRIEMEHIFEEFLQGLYSEIDQALQKLADKTTRRSRPHIISLCGGGGTMAYPLKQLRLRYTDIDIRAPSSAEESCLGTVSGHRIYRIRCALDEFLAGINLGISIPMSSNTSHAIHWKENPQLINTFNFSSHNQNVKHNIITYPKLCPKSLPASVEHLKENHGRQDGIVIWSLKVNLGHSWVFGQKYCIEVICTQRGALNFKAYDAAGRDRILECDASILGE